MSISTEELEALLAESSSDEDHESDFSLESKFANLFEVKTKLSNLAVKKNSNILPEVESQTTDSTATQNNALFYRITTPEGNVNYLYGTMHITEHNLEIVDKAVELSKCLMVEVDITDPRLSQSDSSKILEWKFNSWHQLNGLALRSLSQDAGLTAEQYQVMNEKITTIILPQLLNHPLFGKLNLIDNLPPIYLTTQLSKIALLPSKELLSDTQTSDDASTNTDFNNALSGNDTHLLKLAQKLNKSIISLEQYHDSAIALFGLNLSYQEHLSYFKHVAPSLLDDPTQVLPTNDFEQLHQHGNLAALSIFSRMDMATPIKGFPHKKYLKNVLTDRDTKMYRSMKKHLNSGGGVVAVGAAHLLGILQHLNRAGYHIESIQKDSDNDYYYQTVTGGELKYIEELTNYCCKHEGWVKNTELQPKVVEHIDQLLFGSRHRLKIAKYILHGKHGVPQDEGVGQSLMANVESETSCHNLGH